MGGLSDGGDRGPSDEGKAVLGDGSCAINSDGGGESPNNGGGIVSRDGVGILDGDRGGRVRATEEVKVPRIKGCPDGDGERRGPITERVIVAEVTDEEEVPLVEGVTERIPT